MVLIYFMAMMYAGASIILFLSTVPGALIITTLVILTTVIIVEATNLIGNDKKPVLNFLRRLVHKIVSIN